MENKFSIFFQQAGKLQGEKLFQAFSQLRQVFENLPLICGNVKIAFPAILTNQVFENVDIKCLLLLKLKNEKMKNAGLLSLETIRFIRKAIENDFEFQRILESTESVSYSLSINLSPQAIEEIKHLKRDDLSSFTKLPSPNVISVLNKIILDGRFIDSWQINLDEVAAQLNINLTPHLRQELMSTSLDALYQNNLNDEAQDLLTLIPVSNVELN